MIELMAPILVVMMALALLVAEDLLPTSGVLGILSACCLASLLYVGFSSSTAAGLKYLAIEAVLVPSGFAAWSILLTRTGLGRSAALRPPEPHEIDDPGSRIELVFLVGQTGRALTPPSAFGNGRFRRATARRRGRGGLDPTRLADPRRQGPIGRLVVRLSPENVATEVG